MSTSLVMDLGVLLSGSVFFFFFHFPFSISWFIAGFQSTMVFHNLTEKVGDLNIMIRNIPYQLFM